MSDLPSVSFVPDYGHTWDHEEQRLQWERAVAAAIGEGSLFFPLEALADDEQTGVSFDVSVDVDADGNNRLGGWTLATSSAPFGRNATVFAEVSETRGVLFVGAQEGQTDPALDIQDTLGNPLLQASPVGFAAYAPHTDGVDSVALDGTTLRIARQDNAGTERTVAVMDNTSFVLEKSDSNGASVARIQANETTTSLSHFDPVDANAYAEIDLSEAGSVNIIRSHGAAIDYITLEGSAVTLVRQDVTGQAVAVVTLDDAGPGEGRITAAVPSGTVGSNQAIVDKSRVALITQDPDDGSDKATVNVGVNGSVAVVTTGTFTYNGDEVAVV